MQLVAVPLMCQGYDTGYEGVIARAQAALQILGEVNGTANKLQSTREYLRKGNANTILASCYLTRLFDQRTRLFNRLLQM